MKDTYIRPSLKPLARICASAAVPVDYKVERPNEERALGQANHELLALMALGNTPKTDFINKTAEYYRVDPLRLIELYGNGEEAFETLRPYFPTPEVEMKLPGGGTADLVQIDVDEIIAAAVADWKKRKSADVKWQVLDYCRGVRQVMIDRGLEVGGRTFKGVAVYCEGGGYDVWDFRDADFEMAEQEEARIRRDAGKVYVTGDHCSFCPRFHTCGPYHEEGVRGASALMKLDDPSALSLADAADLYGKAKVVEEQLGAFRRWLSAVLKESDGTLPLGNGKELYVQTAKDRHVNPALAWPVLQQVLDPSQLEQALEVKLGYVIKAVRAANGLKETGITKKEAEETLMQALRDVDALSITERQRLGTRKERKDEA